MKTMMMMIIMSMVLDVCLFIVYASPQLCSYALTWICNLSIFGNRITLLTGCMWLYGCVRLMAARNKGNCGAGWRCQMTWNQINNEMCQKNFVLRWRWMIGWGGTVNLFRFVNFEMLMLCDTAKSTKHVCTW